MAHLLCFSTSVQGVGVGRHAEKIGILHKRRLVSEGHDNSFLTPRPRTKTLVFRLCVNSATLAIPPLRSDAGHLEHPKPCRPRREGAMRHHIIHQGIRDSVMLAQGKSSLGRFPALRQRFCSSSRACNTTGGTAQGGVVGNACCQSPSRTVVGVSPLAVAKASKAAVGANRVAKPPRVAAPSSRTRGHSPPGGGGNLGQPIRRSRR
jgi:hypothetical protein